MPELPEVETVVRGLREPLVGRTIYDVWYERAKVIQTPTPDEFAARIIGQTVRAVSRRAKYIVCQLDHDLLTVHLRMTGRLYITQDGEAHDDDRWLRLRLTLDQGRALHFSDARRFGRVALVRDIGEIAPDLGPEPLDDDFSVEALRQRLAGRHRTLKALLLDQSFVVGVGNIYADEALHLAGIHPLRSSNELKEDEVIRLHSAIRTVLTNGIDYEGATINWYRKPDGTRGESQEHFHVYGREGQPCLACGHPIEKIRVAQRGTHFCPVCQPQHSS